MFDPWAVPFAIPEILGLGGFYSSITLGGERIFRPVPMSKVLVPADMIVVTEAVTYEPRLGIYYSDLSYAGPISPNGGYRDDTSQVKGRHRGKYPVLFADSHAEVTPLNTLYRDRRDAKLRRWNNDNEPHADLIYPDVMAGKLP